MNVLGKSFTFNGISSTSFNLALCLIDSNQTSKDSVMSWSVNKGDITPHRYAPNFYSRQPEQVLQFDITFIKSNSESFTPDERRTIINWLTEPISYAVLTIEDDADSMPYHQNIEYCALVTDYSEFVPVGDVYGMTFHFECSSPYGFAPLETTTFSCTDTANITVNNTSDDIRRDYYPVIWLKAGATGNITITNTIYPQESMILAVKNGQELLIDCQMGDITDMNVHLFDYSTDTNLTWLRLAHGENHLTITGPCTGEIRCKYMRKAGI